MSEDDPDKGGEHGCVEGFRHALEVLESGRRDVTTLRASFRHVIRALHAERAYLARIGPWRDVTDVLDSRGLAAHDIHAVKLSRTAAGLSVSVLEQAVTSGRPVLLEDTRNEIDLERVRAFEGGAWSVLCAVACEPQTRVPRVAFYFLGRLPERAFTPDLLPHLNAYLRVLGREWGGFRHTPAEISTLGTELAATRASLRPERSDQPEIVGESDATCALRDLLSRVVVPALLAPRPDPVLILGPTGSGKEVVARHLHRVSSRARGRFIGLNCATFKGEILEAKLFGHVRGAFTGALTDADGVFVQAQGGVLFLDEVGDMPEDGQVMLLRALETRSVRPVGGRDERSVDAQVICATNVDLERAVRRGRFREDLFHRINGLCVRLQPLCERRDDVQPLLLHYLVLHEQRLGRRLTGISAEALGLLVRYDWPGNVRELSRACSTLALHARADGLIDTAVLAQALPQLGPARPSRTPVGPLASNALFEREYVSFRDAMDTFARAYIEVVHRRCGGSRTAMSRYLDMSRSSVYRYLTRFGLPSSEDEPEGVDEGGGEVDDDPEGDDDGFDG